MPNVEIKSTSFYFNEVTPETVLSLQTNLVKCGYDPTILVYQQPQPHNQTVYYTQKKMQKWDSELINGFQMSMLRKMWTYKISQVFARKFNKSRIRVVVFFRRFFDKFSIFIESPVLFVARVAINPRTTTIFVTTPFAHVVLFRQHISRIYALFTFVPVATALSRTVCTDLFTASIARVHARSDAIFVVFVAYFVEFTRHDQTQIALGAVF